jgi:hypothetical protein
MEAFSEAPQAPASAPPASKACPKCGAAMELAKASEGARISTPYFPKHLLRSAELPRRERPADFWACSCDHCEEA